MMQLMPGTAREEAGKIGVGYDLGRLTSDPSYNVMLGSSYFRRMVDHWDGNYVLAVASYNAGAGNVRKWVRNYGDPRSPGVDTLRWIEQIPFAETKGYVQRVMENSVVYDRLNPTLRSTSRASACRAIWASRGPADGRPGRRSRSSRPAGLPRSAPNMSNCSAPSGPSWSRRSAGRRAMATAARMAITSTARSACARSTGGWAGCRG